MDLRSGSELERASASLTRLEKISLVVSFAMKIPQLNAFSNLENAENDLWKHIEEMKKSNIQEILKLQKTLINWSQETINSFTFIDGRRITNGIMESKNGIAKEIKNNAKGYKNFLRYRNRCLYCMNKTTKPNYAGSHKSIRMKGWPRGRYKKNK